MFKRVASLFVNETLYGVCNFITSILLARFLGPENFAIWGIILLMLGYAESFGRLKVDVASVYVVGKNRKENIGDILFSINIITILSLIVIVFLFLLSSEIIFSFLFQSFESIPRELIFPIASIFIIQGFFLNYLYIFLASENSFIFGFINFLRSFILLIFVLLLFFDNSLTTFSLVQAVFFSYLLPLLFLILYFQFRYRHTFSLSYQRFRELLKSGTEYYMIGISSQINLSMPLIIASQFLSPASIGVFSVAKSLSETIFSRISAAFHTILYSYISNIESANDGVKVAIKTSIVLTIILSLIYIAFYTFSSSLINLLYGEEFNEASTLIKPIMLGYVLYYSAQTLNNYLYGIGKIDLLKYFYSIAILFQIIIGFILYMVDSSKDLAYLSMFNMILLSIIFFSNFIYIIKANQVEKSKT